MFTYQKTNNSRREKVMKEGAGRPNAHKIKLEEHEAL